MDVGTIFSETIRRDPYPLYAQLRAASPVLHVPPPFDGWMVFDHDGVRRVLTDVETFSSAVPAPQWFIFLDPPQHTKLRGLISRAFTPGVVAGQETRIREISRTLLDAHADRGEIDLATEYAVPLAMRVIAGMIGIPEAEWARFRAWSDIIMRLSFARSGGEEAERAKADYRSTTAEMGIWIGEMIADRLRDPQPDLLTRLVEAEVDGQLLSSNEILGFIQLLIAGGQETTANLINNMMLALMENPGELELLRMDPARLPGAIEEALRFRSPLQWVMRVPRRDVEMNGQTIPAGKLVLAVVGSANRDPKTFPDPDRFNIRREPSAHLAFGHGIHFCLGAALARLETRIAISDLLGRFRSFELGETAPWVPRQALNVLGPSSLPLRLLL
ncbi:MAG TPA: cytochrome P450 [Bryobacteraceae bacterium]|nr:cytochrome P450 [Bryobacteraceae bacterium]